MLEVKIFRFNAKNDVLRYYKPYFFDSCHFMGVAELLYEIKKNDPYFDYEGCEFVKINGVVTPLTARMDRVLARFGANLAIEPLSTKRATKDLLIDDSDFWAKFEPFSKFASKDDKAYYASLKPYFYAGFMSEFEPNFIGSSAIIFAKFLCEKYPDKKDQILALVDNSKFGVWIACGLENFIFEGADELADAISYVKSNLKEPLQKLPEIKDKSELTKLNAKHDFKEFAIATYGEILPEIKSLKAKFITLESANLPCGFDLLRLNDELAFKLASEILFEAFDGGADFLLVGHEKAFYMFDTLSKEIEKFKGRKLNNFYILRESELIAIANKETTNSLKDHKLKVHLI
ncbi:MULTISPECIES: DUF5644 domain-containing protein [unclassified Campylobacter]|uniref:HdrB C-terminal domain-containing protein n=1 Tax=unclassified Campylobacter TaxID=2593542 RepID=UPI001474A60C|nr:MULTISPECIES: DUF5644 domain-containing protein [unclassified Campylobacter]